MRAAIAIFLIGLLVIPFGIIIMQKVEEYFDKKYPPEPAVHHGGKRR